MMVKGANGESEAMFQPDERSIDLQLFFNGKRLNCTQKIMAFLHSVETPLIELSICLYGSPVSLAPVTRTYLPSKARAQFFNNWQASGSYVDCQSVRISGAATHRNATFAIEVTSEVLKTWGIMGLHVESPFDLPRPRAFPRRWDNCFSPVIILQKQLTDNKKPPQWAAKIVNVLGSLVADVVGGVVIGQHCLAQGFSLVGRRLELDLGNQFHRCSIAQASLVSKLRAAPSFFLSPMNRGVSKGIFL
jgi:hypothetical protein